MDKVRGGTPRGGSESMCKSCRLAQITKGINNQELVLCRAAGNSLMRVNFPVVECSVYEDKSQPPLYEMQNIAWIVKSRNRGPMGFTEGERTEIIVEPPGHDGQHGIGPVPQDRGNDGKSVV